MDTFGRLPNEINEYIKKLYDDPIITLEKVDDQYYLCICYPTNKIKLLLIPYIRHDFYEYRMEQFQKFITEKKLYYHYQVYPHHKICIIVDTLITIRINKMHNITLAITCLDQLIEVLTQYYNICKN
jgi:hypothetical protein